MAPREMDVIIKSLTSSREKPGSIEEQQQTWATMELRFRSERGLKVYRHGDFNISTRIPG
jgi:hypothetical protein